MKNIILTLILFQVVSCSKDRTSNENRNAIISETKQFKYFQTNGKLDSAIGTNEKLFFYYKDSLIDSIHRFRIYKKIDNSYFFGSNRSYKFEYLNGKLIEEKTGEYIYDSYKNSLYAYLHYPYNSTKYSHLSDTVIEQSWNNIPVKGYLNFKNQNLIKNIHIDDVYTYEYDDKYNPFNNFIGLNKLYNFRLFSHVIQNNSKNNIIKYSSRYETTHYSIEYNSTQNPTKIISTTPYKSEEIKY
jgi:hypothetical protein